MKALLYLLLYFLVLPLAAFGAGTDDWIAVLTSPDSGLEEKARACQRLGEFGGEEAVPALAALLNDPVLDTYARAGLERIPGEKGRAALAQALATCEGAELIGVVESLGTLGATETAEDLEKLVGNSNPMVSDAALRSLGRMGPDTLPTVLKYLQDASADVRASAATACLLAVEHHDLRDKNEAKEKIFDAILKAEVPSQTRLAALRGAILAKTSIPFLVKQLRSDDGNIQDVAFMALRSFPKNKLAEALHDELKSAHGARQVRLIHALRDCANADTAGVLIDLLGGATGEARLATMQTLGHLGGINAAAALLNLSGEKEAAIALAALEGDGVDERIIDELKAATNADERVALIALLGERRSRTAINTLAAQASDGDFKVRKAALLAMRPLAGLAQVPDLIALYKVSDRETSRLALRALVSACRQSDPPEAAAELIQSELDAAKDTAARNTWARVLSAIDRVTQTTAAQVSSGPSQPNIVVFLVDDMGVMDTSLPFLTDEKGEPKRYPLNDFYRTPNMERLAARGIRFNQFYAMSVCSPTRISIMTGQNAARHGATNWINPDKNNAGPRGAPDWNWEGLKKTDVTLPSLFQQSGYKTIHVGKGHFGPREFEGAEPLNLGFDVNIAGASFGAPGSYYAEENYGHGTKRATHAVPHLEAYHGTDTFLTEALTIEANKAVTDAVHEKKPFYLYFAHYAVHSPFQSDPRFAQNYVDSGKSEKAQAFATLIEGMDKSLGDVLDHLDELGVAENTLVIFLGDNGSDAPLGHEHKVACAAPLRGKKGAHYEGGMRVPFIAAWAQADPVNPFQRKLSIPEGALQTQMASVCDLFPTLAELALLRTPTDHTVDGQSLATLLSGETDESHENSFLMHYPHAPHRSDYFTVYREGDWKVIYHYFPTEVSGGSHYQLYNLREDPFESSDVAAERPMELTRLMNGLARNLKAQDAHYPVDENGKPVKPLLP